MFLLNGINNMWSDPNCDAALLVFLRLNFFTRLILTIYTLCMQYVAHQTTLQAEEVEILLVKGKHQSDENFPTKHPQIPMDELQILKGQETVAGLKASCSSSRDHLVSLILAGWQSSAHGSD